MTNETQAQSEHKPTETLDELAFEETVQEVATEAAETVQEAAPEDKQVQETTSVLDPYIPPGVPHQNVVDPAPEPMVESVEGKGNELFVYAPSSNHAATKSALEHLPPNTEKSEEWARAVAGSDATSTNGEFESALADPDATWSTKIDNKGKRFASQVLKAASIAGKEASGDVALQSFMAYRYGSAGVRIVFYGSGFTLKFDKLDNSSLYEISRAIGSDRIAAGRSTYALALSQHMTYTAETFLDAARKARLSSSLHDDVDLGDAIKVTDFSTMVWGLAAAIWPQGYEIARACIATPESCNHVVHDKVNVIRQQAIRTSNISDEQRSMLATARDNTLKKEDLDKYATLFNKSPDPNYVFKPEDGKNITFILKVPTLNEQIAAGKEWIAEVGAQIARTIGNEASVAARNQAFNELMYITSARQYSHWIDSISFDGGFIKDQKSIKELLSKIISSDDTLTDFFIESVRDFHEKNVGAVIVLPNFKCPSCNKWQMVEAGQDPEGEVSPMYFPIETVTTFLALMSLKLSG